MIKQILPIILVASIAGCVTDHAAAPVNSVALDGLIAEPSLGPEWHQTEIAARQVVFERTVDGKRTTLTYSATPIAPLPDDEAFLRFAETQKGEELSKLKLENVSVHYNRAEKKGVPCVSYDGIYHDKTAQTLPFLSFRGEMCRHRDSSGMMMRVEVAERSTTKEAAYKVNLVETAEQAFSSWQFTEFHKESRSSG